MPRRKENSKHPALRDVVDRSHEELGAMVDPKKWHALTMKDQEFLSQYMLHRDYRKAAQVSNVSLDYLAEREAEVADFREIVDMVLTHPIELGQKMLLELAPISVVRLREMLMDVETPAGPLLNAIKHVQHATRMVDPEPAQGGNTNNFSVIFWEGADKKLEGRVIDAAD